MDPNQSNVPPFQAAWNPYMYGFQGPPSWFPQGVHQLPPNGSMGHLGTSGPQVFHPAEPGDASVQGDEVDVEEQQLSPTPTGKGKRTKVVSTRIKLGNFNPEEDVNLVKSWLEISCDPIASTGKKKDGMWERIVQRYNLRRGSYPERSVRSLQSRWDTIKAEVGKFSSFYADAIRENHSGMLDADKTTHAAANFAGTLKHNFAYMHCWNIMKDAPKWQDPKPRSFAKAPAVDGEATINIGDGSGSQAEEAEERPMVRDSGTSGPQVFHLAEPGDASVQGDEVDVEEQQLSPAPTRKGKGTKVVITRTKLSNFNPEEDVNLVKSWLEISCDPIACTGKKKDRMWERIPQRYNLRRGSYPERSVKSLQCRWNIIKTEVGKFSSFYADAIRENPSGMSDADKTTHAAANFAAILKHNFAYMHCWDIMKDAPKWQDPKPRSFAKAPAGDGEATINIGDGNGSHAAEAEERPMGRDSGTSGPQVFHPAEPGDASVQDDEVDMEGQQLSPAATGKGKRTKVVSTRTKLGNFNPEEDVNLVKSWLEISCDPIASTGKKENRMWERILQRYNLRRGSYPERSVRSLQSRWDTIKAEVGKFSSFYADVIRENPSGMLDADKTTHAAANFAGTLKHYFAYMHCWNIMKDAPKWQDPKPRSFAKATAGDGEATINTGDGNGSQAAEAEERPMGRDSAKAPKKKANSDAGSTSSSEYASRMQDVSLQKISILQEKSVRKNDRFQQLACIDEKRFEEMRRHNQSLLECEQEKIRIMREKHDMDRQEKEKKEDERILGIDLDACTPSQRIYYEVLQEEIIEKIVARRRKRQGP